MTTEIGQVRLEDQPRERSGTLSSALAPGTTQEARPFQRNPAQAPSSRSSRKLVGDRHRSLRDGRSDHFDLSITRHDTAPLASRIWQLRHQYTNYGASDLALAEALHALHTCDAKLHGGGQDAEVLVLPRTH